MTYFEQALLAPGLHFKQLRQVEPLFCNGNVIVRRTHHAIESEIIWEGRHYLLFLPFNIESLRHIEEVEEIARERSIGPLIPHKILYNELSLTDSVGNKHLYDIILQEIPAGMMFDKAVDCIKADDLREAIVRMKSRLDAIGFCHRNLRPYNIVICESGVARPLRYWYAEWESFSDNNISVLMEAIDANDLYKVDEERCSLVLNDDSASYYAPIACEGITRLCRGGRYGFIDDDGIQITPFIYSWASDFKEGRAIVSKNGKMGAIDNNGRKVIPVIYKTIEFDVQTGSFTATRDQYHYILDYNGNIIRRTEDEMIEPSMANIEM